MPWGAAAAAGASLIGGVMSSNAATDAANIAAQAQNRVLDTGQSAGNALSQAYTDFLKKAGTEGTFDPQAIYDLASKYKNTFDYNTDRTGQQAFGQLKTDNIRKGMDRSTYDLDARDLLTQRMAAARDQDVTAALDAALKHVGGMAALRQNSLKEIDTTVGDPWRFRMGAAGQAGQFGINSLDAVTRASQGSGQAIGAGLDKLFNNVNWDKVGNTIDGWINGPAVGSPGNVGGKGVETDAWAAGGFGT